MCFSIIQSSLSDRKTIPGQKTSSQQCLNNNGHNLFIIHFLATEWTDLLRSTLFPSVNTMSHFDTRPDHFSLVNLCINLTHCWLTANPEFFADVGKDRSKCFPFGHYIKDIVGKYLPVALSTSVCWQKQLPWKLNCSKCNKDRRCVSQQVQNCSHH